MCTLGAGVVPNRRDDVRKIWRHMRQAGPYLEEAIKQIIENEKLTEGVTGQQAAFFSNFDETDWRRLCDFSPSQLGKTI